MYNIVKNNWQVLFKWWLNTCLMKITIIQVTYIIFRNRILIHGGILFRNITNLNKIVWMNKFNSFWKGVEFIQTKITWNK